MAEQVEAFVTQQRNREFTLAYPQNRERVQVTYVPRTVDEFSVLDEALVKLRTVRVVLESGSVVSVHPLG
jgi:hypothetical protein